MPKQRGGSGFRAQCLNREEVPGSGLNAYTERMIGGASEKSKGEEEGERDGQE